MRTPPLQKPRPLVPPPDEIMTPGRRSKRNSVANAVTVTGVTEALLVGEGAVKLFIGILIFGTIYVASA